MPRFFPRVSSPSEDHIGADTRHLSNPAKQFPGRRTPTTFNHGDSPPMAAEKGSQLMLRKPISLTPDRQRVFVCGSAHIESLPYANFSVKRNLSQFALWPATGDLQGAYNAAWTKFWR